jgi:hypothetical protein
LNFAFAIAQVSKTGFTHVSVGDDSARKGDFATLFKMLKQGIGRICETPFLDAVGVVTQLTHSGKFAKADVFYRFFGAHWGRFSLLEATKNRPSQSTGTVITKHSG